MLGAVNCTPLGEINLPFVATPTLMLRVGVAKYSNKFDIISLAYSYLCNMVAKILTLTKRNYYPRQEKLLPSRGYIITLSRVMHSPREGNI